VLSTLKVQDLGNKQQANIAKKEAILPLDRSSKEI
jgi:hypothetical protein